MAKTFYIAAGGTGGHIIPGIIIGQRLSEANEDLEVHYLCGSRTIEWEIYESNGISPTVLKLDNRGNSLVRSVKLIRDFFTILKSFFIRRPAGVLAMGGAVCFPALTAAILLRIPIFLHESNRIPGRVIRVFGKFARVVFTGMEGCKGANVKDLGNPARNAVLCDEEKNTVLCFGGSQGASFLNESFRSVAKTLKSDFPHLTFKLISGASKEVEPAAELELVQYDSDIPMTLGTCILAISRSGSGSIADLAAAGVPAILIPYPYAKDNHQLANAEWVAERGGAIVLTENEVDDERLVQEVRSLLVDSAKREGMGKALKATHRPDTPQQIAETIVSHLQLKSSESASLSPRYR